ncbi:MAG: ATP-binding cassette domain-containing protein [Flavobacteriaceae bacterium]|nr:ATP-binding cassette domain-containing protein [Flavobacteriaceae bacterium]
MLQVQNISFAYQEQKVLDTISFSAEKGEHLAIVGESGSGKTTLLKLLYGEHDLDSGAIFWNDAQILGPKFNLITGPDFMKYIAQEFDLMPYTSVEANIGDFLSNLDLEKKQHRIDELIEAVELQDVAKTHARYLSGGQKQRVAIAKALAKRPEVLLLDEPFSHIDNLKRQSLRRSLFHFLKEKKITCIVATHDKNDVLGFADSMLVLDNGRTIAKDRPESLYKHPKNGLIASFFDEFNEFELSDISSSKRNTTVIIYPHEIEIVNAPALRASVKNNYFQGTHYLIEADFNGQSIFLKSKNELKGLIHFKISEQLIALRSNL